MLIEQPRVDLALMETASFCFARGGGAKRSRPSEKKDTVDSGNSSKNNQQKKFR